MEESRHPDFESELADAMKSFHRSSCERSEHDSEVAQDKLNGSNCLDYDGWKCRLLKEDRKWVIYIDGKPTHLQFADEQSVSLELLDSLLYLRVDGGLYILTISKDGKAKAKPWSKIGNTCTSTLSMENLKPVEIQTETPTVLEPTGKEFPTLSCKTQERCVKLLKKNDKWSLSRGDKEMFLPFGEHAAVSLETTAEDTYIQADGLLYEVHIDSAGEITIEKIKQAIVMDRRMKDKSSGYACKVASYERSPSVSFESDLETSSENEKLNMSQSLILRTEKVPGPHDAMLTQSLHSRNRDPAAGKGDMVSERKINNNGGIAINGPKADKRVYRETNQKVPETTKPIFPDDKNAPSNISTECRALNKRNDEETLLQTDQIDTGNIKESGAIPKSTRLATAMGYGVSTSGRTSAKEITQDEGSLNATKPNQPGDQLDRSEVKLKKPDPEKDKERKHELIVSTAVRVDDDRIFDFLTTSEIKKGLADANKVKIVPRKMSGRQGFEIIGVPKSVQETEKALKDILKKTATETFTLEAKGLSADIIRGRITSLKNTLGERFDVLTNVAVTESRAEGRNKYHTSTSEEKVISKSKNSQVIVQSQTPKSVIWTFPGGYSISLYNKPVEETTASAIVRFIQWNGENSQDPFSKKDFYQQITYTLSADGIGGFVYNVSVGLPNCTDTKANYDALKELLRKVLLKTVEAKKSSVSFSLQNIQNWSCHTFVDCLLMVTWEHFRSQIQDKPVFVELCSPKADEYQAALFQCLRAVTEMEKGVESLDIDELKTEIVEGKLNLTNAEVLVNTTSPFLHLNAGAVSAALLKTAGDKLQDDCRQLYPKGIQWGEIAVTYGHGLPCSYVFHGALPAFFLDVHKMSEGEKFTAFRTLMDACLTKASELGCRTIAFPVLGIGNLKYPIDLVASEMLLSIEKFQKRAPRSTLRVVYIVVYPSNKHALQKLRRLQAELKVDTSKHDGQPQPEASLSDESREDEENVESVTVELTGLRSDIDNTLGFIKKQWSKSVSNDDRTFKVRLPHSLGDAICKREDGKLTQCLEDKGVDVAEVESEYYATTNTFQGLKNAYTLIDKFSENKFGKLYSLGQFEELDVIVEMHDISLKDFKVMEKIDKSTLRKYDKDGVTLNHERNSVFINGRAKYVEPVLNETEKLIAFVRKFEELCIDGNKRTISKSSMIKIAKKLETNVEGEHDVCVLFDQTQNKLHIFARNKQILLDMRREVLDYTSGHCEGLAEKSAPAEKRQSDKGETLADNHSTRLKTTKPIHITTKHGSVNVFIYKEDLLKTPVECIVSAANEHLTHVAGVAAAIAHAAGSELITESCKFLKKHHGRVPAGNVVQTTTGNLKHKYKCILHAVGPNWRDYQPLTRETLDHCKLAVQSVVHKCLDLADRDKLKSIAIPAISAGYQGVPSDICALQYAEGINQYLKTTKRPIVEEVHFVDLNDDTIKQIKKTFSDYFVDGKVVNVDSKYITDKSVTTNTNVNSKMTGRPKTDQGKSKLGDISKSETVKEHVSIHTVTASGFSSVKEDTKPDGTKLENPTLFESSSNVTNIQFTAKQELQLYTANIVELHAIDAIVVCEEPSGKNVGHITKQLLVKGAAKYIGERGRVFQPRLNFGEVVVTSGGDSQFKFVFHALLHERRMFQDMSKWYDAFQKILKLIFQKAVQMKSPSIAMPVMGADSKTQDLSEYVRRFIQSYKVFCLSHPTQELAIHLVSSEPSLTRTLKTVFEQLVLGQQRRFRSSEPAYPPSVHELTHDSKMDKQAPSKAVQEDKTANCVICLDKLENPQKLKCGHVFCKECIDQHLRTKQNCPVCGRVFGKLTGNQPPGKMKVDLIPDALPGYESCKTIRIVYVFNSGVQGPEHPEPGQPYTGISRVALLPNNDEGCKILKLLKIAFDRRLTFTIGQSRTTGHTGVITWNDIHHKTDYRPNTQFGYPDPTYFDRVKDELTAKGVTEDDLK